MRNSQGWFIGAVAMGLALIAPACGPAALRANLETPVTGPPGAPDCPTLNQPSDRRLIGSSGGRVSAGGQTLIVPPGALPEGEERTFTLAHPARDYVVVQLEPHGQPFVTPARLRLSYAHCGEALGPYSIYRWTPGEGWVKLQSTQDREELEVETRLETLSSYALGAE